MALVRAKSLGICQQGKRRRPTDLEPFEHEGPLGTWMELVAGAEAPSPAPSAPEPIEIQSEAVAEVTEAKARKPRKGAE